MAAGTVVSRLLGFARASMLAWAIGIGLAADTFQVANTLPNQFYLLLAGGVLNAVLVPQITKAASHDDGGHEFVNRLLTLSMALLLTATLIVTACAPLLVRLFSSRWDAATLGLAAAFAFICLPQVFFYGLYTLLRPGAQRAWPVRGIHVGARAGQRRRHRRAGLVPRVPTARAWPSRTGRPA